MDEQDDFIDVLKGLPMAANFYNAGGSYTPYVPFVLQLFPGHIRDISMVRFFYYSITCPSFSEIL